MRSNMSCGTASKAALGSQSKPTESSIAASNARFKSVERRRPVHRVSGSL